MINTSLCYIENGNNEWLMLHRIKKENDINKDKWIGIGGKIEDKERPEECVLLRGDLSDPYRLPLSRHRHLCQQRGGDRIYASFYRNRI